MDEGAYRNTYQEVNPTQCVYERSILTNQCRCSQGEKFCLAEREAARCNNPGAQQQCSALLDLLFQQARFALKSFEDRNNMPYNKVVRIQVGGLRGLQHALQPDEPHEGLIDDVHDLIQRAKAQFGGLEQLPFSQIMQQIASYQTRTRSRRR